MKELTSERAILHEDIEFDKVHELKLMYVPAWAWSMMSVHRSGHRYSEFWFETNLRNQAFDSGCPKNDLQIVFRRVSDVCIHSGQSIGEGTYKLAIGHIFGETRVCFAAGEIAVWIWAVREVDKAPFPTFIEAMLMKAASDLYANEISVDFWYTDRNVFVQQTSI